MPTRVIAQLILQAAVCCGVALVGVSATLAQTPATATITTPQWSQLSAQQQESLKPLAGTWNTLPDGRRRKWLAVARNFSQMVPAEREKLHARMAEWAALKPKEREQARLNFAETKKLSPSERAANWEAYQALSAQQKKELAEKAKRKPTGAALALKPVPKEKLASVPVTRLSPEADRVRHSARQAIDRNTLLPQRPSASRPVAAPGAAAAPVATPTTTSASAPQ